MATQRFVVPILAVFLLALFFLHPHVTALTPGNDPHSLAVGLLSARDAKPVTLVAPVTAGSPLAMTLEPLQGAATEHLVAGELFLALENGSDPGTATEAPALFAVQAASLGSADAAERLAADIRGHWPDTPVRVVVAVLGGGQTTHRVLAGRYSQRNKALAFTTDLAAYGMDGAFVVELEPGGSGSARTGAVGAPLVLYSRSTGLVTGLGRVVFRALGSGGEGPVPEGPSFLLDGQPYRGSLEIHGGSAGLVAVNMVSLEDYLPGVVPCELGPDKFPQLEALKAQAVTARTYALKHAGRHRSEGFDLCDTPHCQVYGGAGREHPLSSEAVLQTAGLAGYFQGELAETLYTSTCGGHTEISSAVFSGETPPYLSGVPCTTGQPAGIAIPARMVRPSIAVSERETGADLGFTLALLAARGIVEDGEVAGIDDSGRGIGWVEAGKWIGRLLQGQGRDTEPGERPGSGDASRLPSRGQLALELCLALGWQERMDLLFTPEDLNEILGPDCDLREEEERALACLLTAAIFQRHPGGSVAAHRSMSRGAFAAALARLLLYLEPGLLTESALTGAEQGHLVLRTGEKVEQRGIAEQGIGLFEERSDTTLPVGTGRFRIGDRVQVLYDKQWRILLMVRIPADGGAAADRYSPYALWSIVVDREAIEALLEGNGHRVGQLTDLQPLGRGPGGRLTRLQAVGTRGNTVLRGLDIRWNLGTRENFFFIDRLPGPDGSIRSYRFTGRGWGHGVGMCQVGAAGLADAGASFIDILQHYYPGISVAHAGGARP